ncbi:MAG: hypothetical protein ABXS93_03975 [Sulfurimonas sp.]
MKKIFLTLLLPFSLFAHSYLVSDIPLPKTYVLDLDPYECDEDCLEEFLENEQVFSFLAHANRKLPSRELEEARMINAAIFNIGATNANFRIALLLPYKRIGKYATSTTNAVFAYLMSKSAPFTMKSYKIEDESYDTIYDTLEQIADEGIEYVIAPLTKEGVDNVISIDPNLNIYFPTTNKKDVESDSLYLSFGGIDYSAQSDLLLKEAISPLVIFSGKSATGQKLALYQEKQFLHPVIEGAEPSAFSEDHQMQTLPQAQQEENNVFKYYISTRTTNLEHYLKENEKIAEGSFMINTPIIKTGMIMSQLTLYDTNATNILSTQINYNPLLLSMTQYRDRENMIIANSITQQDNMQIEMNSLIGNDIKYDWINYSTIIGIDYFYSKMSGEARVYDLEIVNNQVLYDIELLRPMQTRFVKYAEY